MHEEERITITNNENHKRIIYTLTKKYIYIAVSRILGGKIIYFKKMPTYNCTVANSVINYRIRTESLSKDVIYDTDNIIIEKTIYCCKITFIYSKFTLWVFHQIL